MEQQLGDQTTGISPLGDPNNNDIGAISDDEVDDEDPYLSMLPRILLMGPRRSGKYNYNLEVVTAWFHLSFMTVTK